MRTDRHWSIDKHIPLALIFSLATFFCFQTFTLVWWGANVTFRIGELERQATIVAPYSDRLTRLETNMQNVADTVKDIRDLLRNRPAP